MNLHEVFDAEAFEGRHDRLHLLLLEDGIVAVLVADSLEYV